VMDPIYKQAISSAGYGAQAAISVERYLESLGDHALVR
jgi:thioredoxin reductase